jgi:hypothetical protein
MRGQWLTSAGCSNARVQQTVLRLIGITGRSRVLYFYVFGWVCCTNG